MRALQRSIRAGFVTQSLAPIVDTTTTTTEYGGYVPGQGSQASEAPPLDARELVSGFTVPSPCPSVKDAQPEVPTKDKIPETVTSLVQ